MTRKVYQRLRVIPADTVLRIFSQSKRICIALDNNTSRVFLNKNLKTKTFVRDYSANRLYCSSCGIPGTYFAVDRNHDNHLELNLFGRKKDGREVLMTHDHTVARAIGGANDLSNTTTMCETCNSIKSSYDICPDYLRGRRVFNHFVESVINDSR